MLRLILIVSCLCALVHSAQLAQAADEKIVYNPDEFTISYWSGPPANFNTGERYREVADANFTLALPADNGLTVADNKKMLDFCKAVGLKAIIHDGRIPREFANPVEAKKAIDAVVADYANHPALLGYSITDEPNAAAFDGLGQVVAYLKEKDPRHVTTSSPRD